MKLRDYAHCKRNLKAPFKKKATKKKGAIVLEVQKQANYKTIIDEYLALLPSQGVSVVEAEKRASAFLTALSLVGQWRLEKAEDRSRAESLERTTYGTLLGTLKTGGVTENKIKVESNELYQNSREAYEKAQHEEDYLKFVYDIFMNAHIFYRQLIKGVSSGGV